jgi:hypothetical protein
MSLQSEGAERPVGAGRLPYEAPLLRELPVRSTLTADLSFSTEGAYTDGPFEGRTFGPPASV